MDTYKENVHPFRMWRLNTHKQAFENCYLMTVFEDPEFVLMLPLVFSSWALAISSFPLLLLLCPLLSSLLLPSSPSSLSSLIPSPSYPTSPLLSLPLCPPFPSPPYLTSPLCSPLSLSLPFPLLSFLRWRYQETSIPLALLADWNSGGDCR